MNKQIGYEYDELVEEVLASTWAEALSEVWAELDAQLVPPLVEDEP